MNKIVRYRLDVDFYSRDYDNKACCTSSPIYTKKRRIESLFCSIKKNFALIYWNNPCVFICESIHGMKTVNVARLQSVKIINNQMEV